jgi:hypothetical protein
MKKKQSGTEMERTCIYLSKTQRDKLRAIQEARKETGLHVADFVREAINEWIERYEKKQEEKK